MANDIDPKQRNVAISSDGEESSVLYQGPAAISILDLLLILTTRKLPIILTTIVGGILAAALALVTPPTYTATAIIMLPQQPSSTAAALLGQLGGAAGIASQSLGIKNPADPYVGIMNSRTVADELIAQFGLQNVYGTKSLTDTRKGLASVTSFNTVKGSLIQISVEDQNPKRAADLANAYVDRLQEHNSRLAVTEASQRRLFFERQMEAEKDHLAEAETAFKKMQEQKSVYQVTSQVEAVIRSLAQIRAEVAAREVILQRLKTGATKQNPEVLRQETELKTLRSQLQELETNTTKRRQGDPLMPTTILPETGLEYARLLREVKYHETLFELLAKQFEVAKIDEAKESPVIQVIDRAIPPDKKSAPLRRIYVILGIFTGGVLGIMSAFLAHAAQNPKRANKIAALKKSLWLRRKE